MDSVQKIIITKQQHVKRKQKYFELRFIFSFTMARRRKIPGKKHHGVKDPEKQRQQREAAVKTKVGYPITKKN